MLPFSVAKAEATSKTALLDTFLANVIETLMGNNGDKSCWGGKLRTLTPMILVNTSGKMRVGGFGNSIVKQVSCRGDAK